MAIDVQFLTEMPEWDKALTEHQVFWETLVRHALRHAPVALPSDVTLNVLLADNDTVQRLNRDYRDMDKPTNILSFPQIDDWDDLPMVSEDEPLVIDSVSTVGASAWPVRET